MPFLLPYERSNNFLNFFLKKKKLWESKQRKMKSFFGKVGTTFSQIFVCCRKVFRLQNLLRKKKPSGESVDENTIRRFPPAWNLFQQKSLLLLFRKNEVLRKIYFPGLLIMTQTRRKVGLLRVNRFNLAFQEIFHFAKHLFSSLLETVSI